MYEFQDLTPITGQISKFQEFQDNAQACNSQLWCLGELRAPPAGSRVEPRLLSHFLHVLGHRTLLVGRKIRFSCLLSVFYKIKFKHFQGPSDTDSRTFKDHVCFQGPSRP